MFYLMFHNEDCSHWVEGSASWYFRGLPHRSSGRQRGGPSHLWCPLALHLYKSALSLSLSLCACCPRTWHAPFPALCPLPHTAQSLHLRVLFDLDPLTLANPLQSPMALIPFPLTCSAFFSILTLTTALSVCLTPLISNRSYMSIVETLFTSFIKSTS